MAQLVGLRLRGCHVPALWGRNLRVHSDLVLEAGFTSDGTVDLTDATVDGTFRLAGAVLHGKTDHALLAARLRVSGSIQAIALRANGEVRLRGAGVGGSVHLGGARLVNPGQDALEASGLVIAGNLFCNAEGGRFTAEGPRTARRCPRRRQRRVHRRPAAREPAASTGECSSFRRVWLTRPRRSWPTGSGSTATSSSTTASPPPVPSGCPTRASAATYGCPAR